MLLDKTLTIKRVLQNAEVYIIFDFCTITYLDELAHHSVNNESKCK